MYLYMYVYVCVYIYVYIYIDFITSKHTNLGTLDPNFPCKQRYFCLRLLYLGGFSDLGWGLGTARDLGMIRYGLGCRAWGSFGGGLAEYRQWNIEWDTAGLRVRIEGKWFPISC